MTVYLNKQGVQMPVFCFFCVRNCQFMQKLKCFPRFRSWIAFSGLGLTDRPSVFLMVFYLAALMAGHFILQDVKPASAQSVSQQVALEKLVIASRSGEQIFQVEVMRTMDERARGLMFRRYLPPDRGMLFDFAVEAQVAMWMKDTFIPLDMVFIRKDGTISQIAENTEPHSTRTIASNEPVYAVLELNSGISARLGFQTGDKVIHPLFTKH